MAILKTLPGGSFGIAIRNPTLRLRSSPPVFGQHGTPTTKEAAKQ
ncbi:hypothetical protein RRSWK_03601 [Rhodopirellula sp. SWK7]|nr:hypothetical protein RRSWK_03601 [Rhodopirellula sp. SWK7]